MKKTDEIELTPQMAFAVYSLPGSKEHELICGPISDTIPETGGFVFQRFDKSENGPAFIVANQYAKNHSFSFDVNHSCIDTATSFDSYINSVVASIDVILSGDFEKIVISKLKLVERPDQDLYKLFVKLKEAYKDAFVFLYNVPGEGCWCGATPEILMKKTGDSFLTMALAGTQVDAGIKLEDVIWNAKEIHEQHVIETFIERKLNAMGVLYSKEGPETIKAGNVLHILSTFRMKHVVNALELADALHPGPAICGVPQQSAYDWINQQESHERAHYCGYIGPWNVNNENALFINLRSMRIYKNKYALYLGGGLTKDSDPNLEWDETELKGQTLLSVIHKSVEV